MHPSVNILKPPDDIYRIYHGEELALVCRGEGDPEPTISWKREVSKRCFFSIKIKEAPYRTHTICKKVCRVDVRNITLELNFEAPQVRSGLRR